MKKILVEIFGWYGAVAILLAYALVSFAILSADSLWYQLLNVTGALGVATVSFQNKTYQPGVLNLIWAAVAFVAIFSILQ